MAARHKDNIPVECDTSAKSRGVRKHLAEGNCIPILGGRQPRFRQISIQRLVERKSALIDKLQRDISCHYFAVRGHLEQCF